MAVDTMRTVLCLPLLLSPFLVLTVVEGRRFNFLLPLSEYSPENNLVHCRKGFRPDDLGGCMDKDECRDRSLIMCGLNADCFNVFGSFSCVCRPGYIMNQHDRCVDFNECEHSVHLCTVRENCVNEVGSYACYCKAGYVRSPHQGCISLFEHHGLPRRPEPLFNRQQPPFYRPVAPTTSAVTSAGLTTPAGTSGGSTSSVP